MMNDLAAQAALANALREQPGGAPPMQMAGLGTKLLIGAGGVAGAGLTNALRKKLESLPQQPPPSPPPPPRAPGLRRMEEQLEREGK